MNKIEKTELLLEQYNYLSGRIRNLELEINTLKNTKMYQGDGGLSGVGYDGISTSKTYKITSIVENELLLNTRLISKYKYELSISKNLKQKVDNAIEALRERERKIIKLIFIDKVANKDIAIMLDLTEQAISRIKRKTIEYLSDIIFV